MKKDAVTFVEHILECIELIEEYSEDKTDEDFFDSAQLQDAIIRRIETVEEAVKNISGNTKAEHPGIPWKKSQVCATSSYTSTLALIWNWHGKSFNEISLI